MASYLDHVTLDTRLFDLFFQCATLKRSLIPRPYHHKAKGHFKWFLGFTSSAYHVTIIKILFPWKRMVSGSALVPAVSMCNTCELIIIVMIASANVTCLELVVQDGVSKTKKYARPFPAWGSGSGNETTLREGLGTRLPCVDFRQVIGQCLLFHTHTLANLVERSQSAPILLILMIV